MNGILDGILVLDFSEYIAGPYCGFLLADLGAEVIKIEPPDGSEERRWGRTQRYKGNTRMALTMNRGKKSLCLDMRKEEAKKIIYRLVEKADIVISDAAPNVSGVWEVDHARQIELAERALEIALKTLRPSGNLFVKVFQGDMLEPFIVRMRQHFKTVKIVKPKASRARSSELYILGLHRK